MNSFFGLIKYKLKALFSRKKAFSATVIHSQLDKTSAIRQNVRLYHSSLGKYSYIARNTLVQNSKIGSFCSISEGCNIGMPSHPTDFVSTSPAFLQGNNYLKKSFASIAYEDCPETKLGNDVWIGAHVQIKSGLTIGDGAIIAAGAVVTHDVPPYAIVGGVPAKVIRYRFDEKTVARIQNSAWWDWDDERIKKLGNAFENVEQWLEGSGQ